MTNHQTPRVGVAGILVRPDGRVLLVRRTGKTMRGTWAFPGGHLEWGERLIEAVQREFREETGLLVRPVKLLHVAEVITNDAHYVILDYGVTASQFDVTVGSDASDWRWVNYREIDALPLAAGMAQCLTQSAVRSWLGWRE